MPKIMPVTDAGGVENPQEIFKLPLRRNRFIMFPVLHPDSDPLFRGVLENFHETLQRPTRIDWPDALTAFHGIEFLAGKLLAEKVATFNQAREVAGSA